MMQSNPHPLVSGNKKLFSIDKKECEVELMAVCLPAYRRAYRNHLTGVLCAEDIEYLVINTLRGYNKGNNEFYLDPQYFDLNHVFESIKETNQKDVEEEKIQRKNNNKK